LSPFQLAHTLQFDKIWNGTLKDNTMVLKNPTTGKYEVGHYENKTTGVKTGGATDFGNDGLAGGNNIGEFSVINENFWVWGAQGGGGVKSDPLIPGIYDNSLDNFVYQLSNLDRALDGHYNGTGLPPAPLRVAFSFFPPISVVNAGKTITTGKDLYNRNANSFLERGVLAPFNLVSPFAPTKIQNTIPFMMIDGFDKSKTIYDELWPK